MEAKDIHLTDWMRMLIGNVPAGFLLELVFRAAFFYILIIICMRLMGKRMSSQLSRNELASLVALGASIGVPLTAPERGILPGVVSCMVIVLGHRMLSSWFSRNQRLEKITQGMSCDLVADGVINVNSLNDANVSRESLFEQLRSQSVAQLGAVKRFYFEASGRFTLIKDDTKTTGLCILPETDEAFRSEQQVAGGLEVCSNCGKEKEYPAAVECNNCGHRIFEQAIFVAPGNY